MIENATVLPQADDDCREIPEPAVQYDNRPHPSPNSRVCALTNELFDQMGTLPWDRLNETDQRKLAAAYMRDNPVEVYDALHNIKPECIVECIAALIGSPNRCDALDEADLIDLGAEMWSGMWPCEDLAASVECEYDRMARHWNAEHHDSQPALGRRQAI